eukprot:407804-Rhodomonas_salina.1
MGVASYTSSSSPVTRLRPHYQSSGADVAYCPTRPLSGVRLTIRSVQAQIAPAPSSTKGFIPLVPAYALATLCPVLTRRRIVQCPVLRYAMPATNAYWHVTPPYSTLGDTLHAIHFAVHFAMSGTDTPVYASRYQAITRDSFHVLCVELNPPLDPSATRKSPRIVYGLASLTVAPYLSSYASATRCPVLLPASVLRNRYKMSGTGID